jgi:acetate kinase
METTGPGRVLVVNAGSSSLKLRVLDRGDDVVGGADLGAVGESAVSGGADGAEIKAAIESFGPVDAVGHRVVHGGTRR